MDTSSVLPIRFTVFLVVISVILPASAREKTDVVFLKNGDRITCEIKSLARGMLTAKTDSMSTVQIKWQDIERITSKFVFTVQDSGGRLYVGSLQDDTDQRMRVSGPKSIDNLDHASVVDIQPLEGSRWKRFSGSADLGTSFTRANAGRQLNFSGDVSYLAERYTGTLSYSSTLGSSDGAQDVNREHVQLNGERYLSGKWLAVSQFSFDHNLQLELDRRFSLLGGPGYRIKQTNRSLVTAIGAAAFTRESYFGQELAKNAEGYFGIETQFFKLYSPKFDIVNQFVYMPNFSDWGRRRLELNSKIKVEVIRDFFITFTFYDSYDSRPPSETAAKNDYGFTTGLSWTFRR